MIRTTWSLIGFGILSSIIFLSLYTIDMPESSFSHIDKVQHLLSYGVLMLWFAQLFKGNPRLFLAVAFIGMGVIIEFIQPFTGRQFSYLDMLANSGGVLLGLLIAAKGGDFLYLRLRKHA